MRRLGRSRSFAAGNNSSGVTGSIRGYVGSAIVVATVTGLAWINRGTFTLPDIVMLYMLAIMIVATRYDRRHAVFTVTASVLVYNFVYVPPVFAFNAFEPHQYLSFAVMFAVGLSISGLTARIRRHESEAREKERRTRALYDLNRELGDVEQPDEVAATFVRHANTAFASDVVLLCPKTPGDQSLSVAGSVGEFDLTPDEYSLAKATMHGQHGADAIEVSRRSRYICFPLQLGSNPIGVLMMPTRTPRPAAEFLEPFLRQGALALARAKLTDEVRQASLRAQEEAVRSSLLSAVSHDLRTPLAVITGAATTLRDTRPRVSEGVSDDLLASICDEAERLGRLVGNLLDMTRLQSGALDVKRHWTTVDELVSSALARLEARIENRSIAVNLPEEPLLVNVDPVLLEQVLVNLLDNTLKYTPEASPIEIRAMTPQGTTSIELLDRGPGVEPGTEERIFEKFYRGAPSAAPGAGLGLAICRGIVTAHGGTLTAQRRGGGGMAFVISLPSPVEVKSSHSTDLPDSS